jgi:hypothetical protein
MAGGQRSIDCDLHPWVPGMAALAPYLDGFWRDQLSERGIEQLDSQSYPLNAPITTRADWRDGKGRAPHRVETLAAQALDPWGTEFGILNCLYGVQLVLNEDMAAAFTRALNDWVRTEWLDRDPRLRAAIVLPLQSVERAVDEIERLAGDQRFVQVLTLAMGEDPLGKRRYWPVWEACVKHGLPLAIHAGSAYRHPVTSVGWPSWYLEDYVAQAQGFQSQLASLITEGTLEKFPGLKVVLLESGVSWLPGFLWRLQKTWKGVRFEVPWVNRPPAEILRDQVRLSVQPFDVPEDAATVARLLDQFRSDAMLLWASDWPHAQFDGDARIPAGLPEGLLPKLLWDNPLATYGRIRAQIMEGVSA